MGRPITQQRQGSDLRLSEFYGDAIPSTARLLDGHLRLGRVPLRDPEGHVVSVDLRQAAASFGGDLAESRRYLHRLHAAGLLTVDDHGTVELSLP